MVVTAVFLNLSPVSSTSQVVGSSSELLVEKVNVLLLDWVDLTNDVPVNFGSTRWGGDGSSVNPSVFGVDQSHELSVHDLINLWISSILGPVKLLKEVVDNLNFPLIKISSVVVN